MSQRESGVEQKDSSGSPVFELLEVIGPVGDHSEGLPQVQLGVLFHGGRSFVHSVAHTLAVHMPILTSVNVLIFHINATS